MELATINTFKTYYRLSVKKHNQARRLGIEMLKGLEKDKQS